MLVYSQKTEYGKQIAVSCFFAAKNEQIMMRCGLLWNN